MVDVIVEVRPIGFGPHKVNTVRVEEIILTMHKGVSTVGRRLTEFGLVNT